MLRSKSIFHVKFYSTSFLTSLKLQTLFNTKNMKQTEYQEHQDITWCLQMELDGWWPLFLLDFSAVCAAAVVKIPQITVVKGSPGQLWSTTGWRVIHHWVLWAIASCHWESALTLVQHQERYFFCPWVIFKALGVPGRERAELASFGCRLRWTGVRRREYLNDSCQPGVNLDLAERNRWQCYSLGLCCEQTGFQGVHLLNGWLRQYLSNFTVFAIIR